MKQQITSFFQHSIYVVVLSMFLMLASTYCHWVWARGDATGLQIAISYAQDNANTADTKLESIERQTQEDDDFYAFYKILIGLKQSSKSLFQLTADQEQTLLDIANHRTNTAYNAQALLYLARGEEFAVEMPTLPNFINPSLVQQLSVVFKKENNNTLNQPIGDVYPNPTNDALYMTYQLDSNELATFDLFDSMGRLVFSKQLNGHGQLSVDAKTFSNGIYYCRVISNGKMLKQSKVIVVK